MIFEHAVCIFRECVSPYLLCDCNLQWLVVWIKEKAIGVKETRCSFPRSLQGELITSLRPETLTCGKNTHSPSSWRFSANFSCVTELICSNPHTNYISFHWSTYFNTFLFFLIYLWIVFSCIVYYLNVNVLITNN